MQKKIVLVLAAFFLTLLQYHAYAGPGGPPGPPTAGAPVDGGAIALVAGAAVYGYKKLKQRGEKEKQH